MKKMRNTVDASKYNEKKQEVAMPGRIFKRGKHKRRGERGDEEERERGATENER